MTTTMTGLALGAAMLLLSGCRVDTHRDGDHENVKIATPFGGLSVKTSGDAVQEGVGLSVYPGAIPIRKDSGNDSGGAADVNMSFGSFHLGVKALSYQSGDSPEKVLAFYRKDLNRYGTVILCHHDRPVGSPTVTQDGLSCDDEHRHEVQVYKGHSDGDEDQLKAGSRQHQHIVAVEPRDGGTKIGLVALDLPGHIDFDDGDKDKSDRQ